MALTPHAALLSSPGMGHLIPVLELAKRLVSLHNFTVTVFVVSSHSSHAETQIIESTLNPKFCDVVELPPADISALVDANTAVVTQLCIMMRETLPAFRSAISKMETSSRPTILVVDLFGTEAFPIADEFQMKKYVFIAPNAWFSALSIYSPTLDKTIVGEYSDQTEPLRLPGCKPVHPHDVVEPMLDRSNQQYLEFLRFSREILLFDGILINTWEDLERTTLAALRDKTLPWGSNKEHVGPVFAVGPIARPVQSVNVKDELFIWLDRQPNESVIFISFGSGGTLSPEQMTELAWGLEQSGQRFIWVVRPPTDKSDAAFFAEITYECNYLSSYLPEGFLTRTRDVGRLISTWGPQVEILNHPATGGFLSHCGWNSTLESITNGVPIIGWPLYAEQRMNAKLLREEIGIAIGPKELPMRKVVKREEIAAMVRKILVEEEGLGIRARVKEVRLSGEKALAKGGSSYEALSLFAQHCSK